MASRKSFSRSPPETCPNCGADVPSRAAACPECGASHDAGWCDDDEGSQLSLPDDHFNYDEFIRHEFGPRRLLPRGVPWFWCAISLILVGLMCWLIFR